MRKALPLGIMDYEKLKVNDYYFVDKSIMIKDFLEYKSGVTLITRPRRFGKTLNMSMLAHFFDITKDSKELFKDTAIMQTEYAKELNKWPTIFISFAGIKGDQKQFISEFKIQILKEWQKYKIVFENMDEYDSVTYNSIKNEIFKLDNNEISGMGNSISFLMKMLEKYYHKKVMLFIDEYDTPFIEAHVNGFYGEIKEGLASMLHNSLKLSDSLQQAMITGIQRVAKENIFSDLNNLVVYGVNDTHYASYFGFTTEEVCTLLKYYGLELDDEVKAMYDGYRMGDKDIYNPWSILNYASRNELIPYWVNTSSNTMIKKAMNTSELSFRKEYEQLIREGKVATNVNLGTSFYESSSTENLWGLLVNAGYLTIADTISALNNKFVVRIPNLEVQTEFISLTENYLSIPDNDLSKMIDSLIELDRDQFLDKYQTILLTIPSYHDLKDENSYHRMMLGLCVCLQHKYQVVSNREEGKGRCDIILKAKQSNMPSFILEFKYLKSDTNKEKIKDKLKELANSAINQIKENKYDATLNGKVIYIGLAHYGKEVEMCWEERGE